MLSPVGLTLDVPSLVEVILFPHLTTDRMKAANNSNPLNPANGKEKQHIHLDDSQQSKNVRLILLL